MNNKQLLIVVLVGALGGMVRSILGYFTQSDEGENFNWKKFMFSVLRASIGGSFLVYSTIDLSNINFGTYFVAFFNSVGADVFMKEVYGSLTTKNS